MTALFPESQKLDVVKCNYSQWFPAMTNFVGNTPAGPHFIGLVRDAHPIQLCFANRPNENDLTENGNPKYTRNVPPSKLHGITADDAFPLDAFLLNPSDDATPEKIEEVKIHNDACVRNAKIHMHYTLTDAATTTLNRHIDKYDKDEAEHLAQDSALIASILQTISADSLSKIQHHEDYGLYQFDPRSPKCFTRFAKLLTIARQTHSSATIAGKIARTHATVHTTFDGYNAQAYGDIARVNYDNLVNDFGDPANPGKISVNKLVSCLALGAFKQFPALDPAIFQITNDIESGVDMTYHDVIKQVENFIRENPAKFVKPKTPKIAPAVGFVSTAHSSSPTGPKVALPLASQCKNCNPRYAGKQFHTTEDCNTRVGGRNFDPIAYATRVSKSSDKPWTSEDADRYSRQKHPISFPSKEPTNPPAPVALVTIPPAAPAPTPSPTTFSSAPTASTNVAPPFRHPRRSRARALRTDPAAVANQAFAQYMMDEYDRNQDDDYSDYLDGNY
jgi:hypothetical protein